MPVIPGRFREGETDHRAIAQWCSPILAGDSARLLLLGPRRTGTSHTGYAALRRLLAAGCPEADSPFTRPLSSCTVSGKPCRPRT